MSNTNLHKALLLIIFVGLLMFVYQHNIASQFDNPNTCEVYAQKCTIDLEQGQLIIDFPQQLVVEELLNVKFTLPQGLEIEQVVIEGVNMYMGTLPVHFEPLSSGSAIHQTGEFFLGSCHLSNMQWQMLITLRTFNSDSEQSPSELIIARVLFSTQQR
ncbi:MAG: hypothetical protein ABF267_05455 [Glaciecola sp.]|jgi:hypothetical protein